MDEIDFASDGFADIVAKDERYDGKAYALLMDVVRYLSGEQDRQVSAAEILDEFKERALDQYGPLTYTVLTEWGVKGTEDLGEMMFNLVDARRIGRNEGDTKDDFIDVYDFRETFLEPYQT